jgi:hypothetical protein
MGVCCECCVLSGRGLCDELITCPEVSCRLWWCIAVCDLEKPVNEEAMPRVGQERHVKTKYIFIAQGYRITSVYIERMWVRVAQSV